MFENNEIKKIQMNKSELISEINRLKKEKNAVIMAHYYQMGDIQDIADVIGDSLAENLGKMIDHHSIVKCK